MAKQVADVNEAAKDMGQMLSNYVSQFCPGVAFILYVVADAPGDPTMFDQGAVISNLASGVETKQALQHAADVYNINTAFDVDIEIPS